MLLSFVFLSLCERDQRGDVAAVVGVVCDAQVNEIFIGNL